jgi:uncharacterized membrane protein
MQNFRWRRLSWDLTTGLLFLPGVIIAALGVLALFLVEVEQHFPLPGLARLLGVEPAAAQVVLGTVAGSMITVVTSVYSILLVALSLASMQFSTRIVIGYLRDRVSQLALGACIGTFAFSLIVLRTVRTGDDAFVPPIAMSLAPVLALSALAVVVYFIHHVALGIQANHIVDRIAGETEHVIDAVFPSTSGPRVAAPPPLPPSSDVVTVTAVGSGYIQLVDMAGLAAIAGEGLTIHLTRAMGAFVAAGAPLYSVSPSSALTSARRAQLLACIDLGPVRTMQDDAEYGFRQIVDIALKALSPAVNDPSTAATCLDHLGRLLIRVAARSGPVDHIVVGAGRVTVPTTSMVLLVDLAFEQIRQYARTDLAVSLRLLRVIAEVAAVSADTAVLATLAVHATRVEHTIRAGFADEQLDEMERRLEAVRAAVAVHRV